MRPMGRLRWSPVWSFRNGSFNAGFIQTFLMNPTVAVTSCEFAVPLTHIFAQKPDAKRIRLIFINDAAHDVAPNSGYLDYTLVK